MGRTILRYVQNRSAAADREIDMFHEDVRGWMEDAAVGNILLKVKAGESDGGK